MKYIVNSNLLKEGEERICNIFLGLPKKIKNEIRGLEFANIKQISAKIDIGGSCEGGKFKIMGIDKEFC